MFQRKFFAAALVASIGLVQACTSASEKHVGEAALMRTERIYVCSGYGCNFKTPLDLGATDARRFAEIMAAGSASPEAERDAVSKAVQYFEKRAGAATGVIDEAKSVFGQSGRFGQMDCIDESTNTRALLLYLERRGLLKHHAVGRNVSRGLFIDGRYPHSTAVLHDKAGGEWAIDSWYAPMGGAPDILPMSQWLKRGVMGRNEPV